MIANERSLATGRRLKKRVSTTLRLVLTNMMTTPSVKMTAHLLVFQLLPVFCWNMDSGFRSVALDRILQR